MALNLSAFQSKPTATSGLNLSAFGIARPPRKITPIQLPDLAEFEPGLTDVLKAVPGSIKKIASSEVELFGKTAKLGKEIGQSILRNARSVFESTYQPIFEEIGIPTPKAGEVGGLAGDIEKRLLGDLESPEITEITGETRGEQVKPIKERISSLKSRILSKADEMEELSKVETLNTREKLITSILSRIYKSVPGELAFSIIVGTVGLDLTPVGGSEKGLLKAIKEIDNLGDALKLLQKVGVEDDLARQFAEEIVSTKTDEGAKKLVESITNLQKTTKPATLVVEEIPQVLRPFAEEAKKLDEATFMRLFDEGLQAQNLTKRDTAHNILKEIKKAGFEDQQAFYRSISGGEITTELEPLAIEARKFKSAEEFVKGQGKTVYHATNKDFTEFNIGKANTSQGGAKAVFFSDTPSGTKYYQRGANSKIIEATLSPEAKIFDYKNNQGIINKYVDNLPGYNASQKASKVRLLNSGDWGTIESKPFQDFLKKNGFDGFRVVDMTGHEATGITNTKLIKTKSQLIGFFNKVKSTKVSDETITLYRASPNLPTEGNFKKGTYFADSEQKARYYSESHYKGDPSDIKVQQFVLPKNAVFKEPSTGNYTLKGEVAVKQAIKEKTKRPPSAEKILGKEPPAKITRREDVLLRARIKSEARGARFGAKGQRLIQKQQEFLDRLEKETISNFKRNARKELYKTIQELDLRKWENIRDAMKFPKSLREMSPRQVLELNEVLSRYKTGDEFLPVRMIETIDKTKLKDARTIREVLEVLAKEHNLTIEDVSKLKPSEFHRFMGDTMLAREHPFFERLIGIKNESFLTAQARVIELTDESNELIKLARKSRPRSLAERAIPTDRAIVKWLESAPEARLKLAESMTDEEVRAAQYMDNVFKEYYDYLVAKNAEKKFSRFEDKYFPHVRRKFWEAWKEDGILSAWKEMWQKFEQEQKYLNILDEKTRDVLPYEKWIGFAQYRSDKLIPTANAQAAFEAYVSTLEKARHLDEMIPEIMAYVHALQPRRLTPRGLELDDSLKRFVKEWVNANKGRTPKGFFQPGGKMDWGLRSSVALTRFIDLGLNFTTQFAAPIGEQAMNLTMLKPQAYSLALARRTTKQGRMILNKYENFLGRSFFKELSRASNTAADNLMSSVYALFGGAARTGNEIFLLGKMTDSEFKAGEISTERLAQLMLEMNKYRVVKGAESIMGRTGEALAFKQYKSWAIPIARATITNATDLVKMIKKDGVLKALRSDAGKELFYSVGIGGSIALGFYGYFTELQEKGAGERSFIEDMTYKAMRDSISILGAFDPTLWSSVRVADFYDDLAQALYDLIELDRMESTGELKGIRGISRTLTPRAARQFASEEKESGIPEVEIPTIEIPELEIPSI